MKRVDEGKDNYIKGTTREGERGNEWEYADNFPLSHDLGNMASKASTAYVAFLWAALARKEKGQLNDLFPLLAMIHEVPAAMTRVSFTTTQ